MILKFQGSSLSNLLNERNNYFIGFRLRRGAKSNEGIVDLKSYSLVFHLLEMSFAWVFHRIDFSSLQY